MRISKIRVLRNKMTNLENRAKVTSKQIFNGYYENFREKFNSSSLHKLGCYLCDRSIERIPSPSYVVEKHRIYHSPEGVTAVLLITETSKSKETSGLPDLTEVEFTLYGTEEQINKFEKLLENDK